jgi:hypothetical protein
MTSKDRYYSCVLEEDGSYSCILLAERQEAAIRIPGFIPVRLDMIFLSKHLAGPIKLFRNLNITFK